MLAEDCDIAKKMRSASENMAAASAVSSVPVEMKTAMTEIRDDDVAAAEYRGRGISWVKGSECLALKFALPPFSTPLPSGVQILKQNMHFDPISNSTVKSDCFVKHQPGMAGLG